VQTAWGSTGTASPAGRAEGAGGSSPGGGMSVEQDLWVRGAQEKTAFTGGTAEAKGERREERAVGTPKVEAHSQVQLTGAVTGAVARATTANARATEGGAEAAAAAGAGAGAGDQAGKQRGRVSVPCAEQSLRQRGRH